jgi:hypothetical protein
LSATTRSALPTIADSFIAIVSASWVAAPAPKWIP